MFKSEKSKTLYNICTWICIIIVVILIGVLFNQYFNDQQPIIRAEHFFSSSMSSMTTAPTPLLMGTTLPPVPAHMQPDGKKHMPRPADEGEFARHLASVKQYKSYQ
jgi:hypothetical protein